MKDPAHIREITKIIMRREPGLLVCDPVAVARASGSLAEVLGCVLGMVLAKKGESSYRECLMLLVEKIDCAARSTVAVAELEAADPSPEITSVN